MSETLDDPNRCFTVLLIVVSVLLGGLCSGIGAQTDRQIIDLEDNGEALTNPGMGWMFYYYSHGPDELKANREAAEAVKNFPGLSTVYLRVPWRYLEPQKNVYNWPLLNGPAQRWIENGKNVALRITASERWMKRATPKWVEQEGASGQFVELDARSWQPDYTDAVFRRHLKDLLTAVARRYGSSSDVAFIDMGTFGPGGNGTTGEVPANRGTQPVRQHMRLYRNVFSDTPLTFSDGVEGQEGPHTLANYAKRGGYTIRMVQPDPNDWTHENMSDDFARRHPVILEHGHGGPAKGQGAVDQAERLHEAVLEYRASYVGVRHPEKFLNSSRSVIDRVNRRLGYRLQLRKISLPEKTGLTEEFTVMTRWANAGVAPCYPGGYMSLTLKNDSDGIVLVLTDDSLNMRELNARSGGNVPVKDHKTTFIPNLAVKKKLGNHFLPKSKTATYDVYVSVGKRDGTPKIELPLDNGDGHMRYRIGEITLTN